MRLIRPFTCQMRQESGRQYRVEKQFLQIAFQTGTDLKIARRGMANI